MPRATYLDNGGLAVSTTGTVNVSYPATVNANDMLILASTNDKNDIPTNPAGWTTIGSFAKKELSWRVSYKRATGSESGTVEVTSLGDIGNTQSCVIHRIGNVVDTGTPYDDLIQQDSIKGTTIQMRAAGTPTVDPDNDRHFSFVMIEDDAFASHTTANWDIEANLESATGDGVSSSCFSMIYSSGIDALTITPDTNKDFTGGVTFNMLGVAAVDTRMQVNKADVWKDIIGIKINIGDTWKTVTAAKVNKGDVWKTLF
jgi:hypothetical protein